MTGAGKAVRSPSDGAAPGSSTKAMNAAAIRARWGQLRSASRYVLARPPTVTTYEAPWSATDVPVEGATAPADGSSDPRRSRRPAASGRRRRRRWQAPHRAPVLRTGARRARWSLRRSKAARAGAPSDPSRCAACHAVAARLGVWRRNPSQSDRTMAREWSFHQRPAARTEPRGGIPPGSPRGRRSSGTIRRGAERRGNTRSVRPHAPLGLLW